MWAARRGLISWLLWASVSAAIVASPMWTQDFNTADGSVLGVGSSASRNIRELPCVSRRTGQTGVCMFAYACIKANGTHLGTCIDRFYFGSCCQLDISNEVVTETTASPPAKPTKPVKKPSKPAAAEDSAATVTKKPSTPKPADTTAGVTTRRTTTKPTTVKTTPRPTTTKSTPKPTTTKTTPKPTTTKTTPKPVTTKTTPKPATTVTKTTPRPVVTKTTAKPTTTTKTTPKPTTTTVKTTPKPTTTTVKTTPKPTTTTVKTTPKPTTTTKVTTPEPPTATSDISVSTTTSEFTSEGEPALSTSGSEETDESEFNAVSNITSKPTSSTGTSTTDSTTVTVTNPVSLVTWTSVESGSSASAGASGSGEIESTNEVSLSTSSSGSSTEIPDELLNIKDYKQVCGRRLVAEARIVGGKKTYFGKWPWQVSLRQWRTSTYLHKCGAALLNENWAITAAHCVENVPPSDLLLRLGEHDLSSEDEPYKYQERRIQIVASHPQFDPRTFEYDLALLRFYEPVAFQPNIIPICVPEDDRNFVGDTAFVTGWGRLYENGPLPSVLQEVSVPVINNTLCETMYRSAGFIEHIPQIFICAGWRKGGFDSCEGDSGGPMVIQREDQRWLLAGVISWGIGCAEPNQPGVYTRISEFRDWINQILQF